MSPLLQAFLVAASLGALGALARQAEAHFTKVHLSNRLEPHLGMSGLPEGSPVHTKQRQTLQVNLVDPDLMREVRMGERLELECEAYGGPPPAVQWLRDGERVDQELDEAKSLNNLLSGEAMGALGALDGLNALSGLVSSNQVPASPTTGYAKIISRLVINCALPVHGGVYSCVGLSGAEAKVSAPTSVYVRADGVRNLSAMLSSCQHASAPRITTYAEFVMDVSGSDITLPCKAEGRPQPAVFWKDYNNQLITSGGPGARRNRYKVLSNGSLMIFKARWSDMGEYTCVAQSETGRDNTTTFLYPLSAENCKQYFPLSLK